MKIESVRVEDLGKEVNALYVRPLRPRIYVLPTLLRVKLHACALTSIRMHIIAHWQTKMADFSTVSKKHYLCNETVLGKTPHLKQCLHSADSVGITFLPPCSLGLQISWNGHTHTHTRRGLEKSRCSDH